ncbi:MAG: cryptochrome/photolyase family protein [Chlamydiia bacterium]
MVTTVCWFQSDLRMQDHSALTEAAVAGHHLVCLFIWDPEAEGDWALGPAQRAWLGESLRALAASLEARGQKLIVRSGDTAQVVAEIVGRVQATQVFAQRRVEPWAIDLHNRVKKRLKSGGSELVLTQGDLLYDPKEIVSRKGAEIKVFTPFWNACRKYGSPPRPTRIPILPPPARLHSEEIPLCLSEDHDLGNRFRGLWSPGEKGAQTRWRWFLNGPINDYEEGRDRPDADATSKISAWLHFGEISPRQLWHDVRDMAHLTKGAETYLRELGWREFSHHMLFHFPDTPEKPLRPEFARFPWCHNKKWLRAWQEGVTGYPLVDAGMRQLYQTGWMHNRVRMNTASFLVKHLRLPWLWGARWFWERLVDADLANNTMGWQWSAGCGADAAPYFRIFNPVLQGEKFDPNGAYVREWIPELSGLPLKWIHRPWEAPEDVRRQAGVVLGQNYPMPIVEHCKARQQALDAFASLRECR